MPYFINQSLNHPIVSSHHPPIVSSHHQPIISSTHPLPAPEGRKRTFPTSSTNHIIIQSYHPPIISSYHHIINSIAQSLPPLFPIFAPENQHLANQKLTKPSATSSVHQGQSIKTIKYDFHPATNRYSSHTQPITHHS